MNQQRLPYYLPQLCTGETFAALSSSGGLSGPAVPAEMASASAERRLAVLAGQAVTTTGGCYGKEVSQSYLANGDALGEQAQAQLENRRKSGGQASTGQSCDEQYSLVYRGLRPASSYMVIHPEVQCALSRGRPVVALESSIISQGMPYPRNLATAREVEAILRQQGVVPATVAVLGGVPHVGLTDAQLQRLAQPGAKIAKCSRRDLPHVCGLGLDAATTVSSTMLLAARAGVRVFVTGGIGGVHRGADQTWDVSADLTELGRTPVAVVCAGAKSILDLPRTLEYLETQGVCVAAMGTDEFPAFYTRSSGCRAPCRVDSAREAASLVHGALALRLGSGQVIAVPIPAEHEAAGAVVQAAVETALGEAAERGVSGNATTPFLLRRVADITGGASLEANVWLVKNNARVGGEIAKALAEMDAAEGAGASR